MLQNSQQKETNQNDERKIDEQTYKEREWDDWKDAHPKVMKK